MTTLEFGFATPRVACGKLIESAAHVDALVAAGITHVHNACLMTEHRVRDVLQGRGIDYYYNATADDVTEGEPWFLRVIGWAVPILARGGTRIYAHCSAGLNRGPLTAYTILRACGHEPMHALSYVRAARPGALENEWWGSNSARVERALSQMSGLWT